MKSKLKLAIYEAYESGFVSAEDAQSYLDFVECADLEDAEDVQVLTEMVDSISYDDEDAMYESAEDYVLTYLLEKAEKTEKKEKSSLKDKLSRKKDEPEKKSARLKAKIAANKGKILKGAAIAAGAAGAVGAGVAGYKNKDNIADAIRGAKHKYHMNRAVKGRVADILNGEYSGDGADGMNESVEALIYESVECGDISVSEAAGLLELLGE